MSPAGFAVAAVGVLGAGAAAWLLLWRGSARLSEQDLVELRKELADVRFTAKGLKDAGRRVRLPFEHGVLLLRQSRAAEAVKRMEKAAENAAESLEPALHNMVGVSLYLAGKLTEAPSQFLKAVRLARDLGQKDVEAAAMGNLGLVYLARNEKDKAQEHHLESLRIDREAGNAEGEAVNLGRLGLISQGQGRSDDALEYLAEALARSRAAGFRLGEANSLGRMALIHQVKGRLDKALGLCGEALDVARAGGLRLVEAELLGNVGLIHLAKEDQDKALAFMLPSLQLFMAVGSETRTLGAVSNLHQVYRVLGRDRFAAGCRKLTGDEKFIGKLLHLMGTVDEKVRQQPEKQSGGNGS
ncbi:MAG: tetratricopeptide repeat protein [candidate division WOR-3 bacterium]|nr:MAG: tetratricopeptide repeat protein [candidate division WOR-3 bacterium]